MIFSPTGTYSSISSSCLLLRASISFLFCESFTFCTATNIQESSNSLRHLLSSNLWQWSGFPSTSSDPYLESKGIPCAFFSSLLERRTAYILSTDSSHFATAEILKSQSWKMLYTSKDRIDNLWVENEEQFFSFYFPCFVLVFLQHGIWKYGKTGIDVNIFCVISHV